MLICMSGFVEANTDTQVESKLDIVPFSEAHKICVIFSWLLGFDLVVDEKTIDLRGRHVDKMRISYKNKGGVFQEDSLCN